MKRLHKTHSPALTDAVMFIILLLVTLVATSCGQSGVFLDEFEPGFEEALKDTTVILSVEDDTMWPDNYSEMYGVTEDDEGVLTTSSEPHVIKEPAGDSVWKVFLVVAVLLLAAVVGVLSTVYYLCMWRGGRVQYEPQKDACPV